ncbi:ABC transporter permease [Aureimonas fodinaquatilis]|uniref:ABC transporter permease n=1 Tax=Aureimonas fodinaquatilis TaxID=2565783 RepID=A0A5B0DUV5_9HYPH|nr:ABC transporter permease [Aureimonas fodinaquatilis]KAA0969571.1 ABC transporter permease [Aureimonas fodinaquatilis]
MTAVETTLHVGPARAADKATVRRWPNHLAIFVTLLVVWELAARTGLVGSLTLPAPTAILAAFYRLYITQGNIYFHLGITLGEVFAGFLAGSVLGIGLAVIVGMNETVRRLFKPYIILIEATPRIAMGPLIIAWLGFGWGSKIAIVMLVCFFAPFMNTLSGMLNVDSEAHQMFRSLRANKWQIFSKLMLPDSMPVIMAGLRLAMASALSGALVAEFISANEGMGVLLKTYTASLNMPSAFACLLTLTAIGFLIFRSMEAIDRAIVFWRDDARASQISARRAAAWKKRAATGRARR